jgi:hypothetical protein
VRPAAGGADLRPQRALAAGLDRGRGGLAEDGQVRPQPLGQLALDPAEPVAGRVHLLAVVQHHGEVVARRRDRGRDVQDHRVAALHVAAAAAVQQRAVAV